MNHHPLARNTDPDTSHLAQQRTNVPKDAREAYQLWEQIDPLNLGMVAKEFKNELVARGMSDDHATTLRKRVSCLFHLHGLLIDSGKRRGGGRVLVRRVV